MDPPLSVVLYHGLQRISGAEDFFRGGTLRKGKKLCSAEYVYAVQELSGEVLARCQSQVKRVAYEVELQLSPQRAIISSKCTCKAGLGKCKHAAAVVLWVNEFQPASCTELPQTWGRPSRRPNIDAKESIEELFGRPKKIFIGGTCPDEVPPSYVHEHFSEIACPHNDIQKLASMSASQKDEIRVLSISKETVLRNSHLSSLQKMISWEADMPVYSVMAATSQTPTVLTISRCQLTARMTVEESKFFFSKVLCSREDAEEIAAGTVLQAGCKRWHNERAIRLSSSIAHAVVARRLPLDSLGEQIKRRKPFFGKAVMHGRKTEAIAREQFEQKIGGPVLQVGLIVHLKQPWLCASPDGLFKYGDQTTLLEIKCPYSRKDDVLIDHTKESSFIKYIVYRDGHLEVNKRHQYYTQMQITMYVTNTTQCFFFVYTSKQTVPIVVERDEHFLSEAIPRLEHFYFNFYIKHLV
ncbi:uncharacterized protein [Dermacentor andersoni]|uniref:uncharacterized protein n=1 Tax=Dermacentor andersoni TaxID=34620 RepID=UPI003B3B084C